MADIVINVKEQGSATANKYFLQMANTLKSIDSRLKNMESQLRKTTSVLNAHTAAARKANKAHKKVAKNIKKTGDSSKKANSQLKGMALRFVSLQFAMQKAQEIGQKLHAWVTDSIKKFRDFEKAIAEVSTILSGEAYKATYALKVGIENLSKAYGKSATDLAKATYDILSAAFDSSEAMGVLNVATKAAVAGLSDVKTSVDIFTSVLNSYAMGASRAAEVSDILFQSVIRGKFVYEDLKSALQYVAPIAAQAGISFQELMAALSTATRHGLRLDMTSRGLALAIQNIANPTESAAKAAKEYGIDMSALALRTDGLTGFFTQLNEATKEFGKGIISELIPNMRSLRIAMVLAADQGLEGFAKDLNLVTLASGKTNEALQKMMHTSQMQADVLVQQMDYLDRKVGEHWEQADIWWKKTEMWWRVFLTGGDANAALAEIDAHFSKMEDRYYDAVSKLGEPEQSIFDRLMGTKGDKEKIKNIASELLSKPTQDEESLKRINLITGEWEEVTGAVQRYAQAKQDIVRDSASVQELDKEISKIPEEDRTGYVFNEEGQLRASQYSKLTDARDAASAAVDRSTKIMEANEEAYNAVDGTLATFNERIYDQEVTVRELDRAIKDLNKELNDEYVYGQKLQQSMEGRLNWELAVLKADKELEDLTHGINMGLKLEGYNMNHLSADMREAIGVVKSYNDVKEDENKITDINNQLLRINNLEMMKIQLAGMKRRRGMTRSQQRAMKRLQISNLELRINTEENTAIRSEAEMEALDAARKYIDQTVLAKQEETYQLKYNYDQQILDLQDHIDDERKTLAKRETSWAESYDTLALIASTRLDFINDIASGGDIAGFDAAAAILAAQAKIDEIAGLTMPTPRGAGGGNSNFYYSGSPEEWRKIRGNYGFTGEFQSGTYRVPSTGLAMVHEGESITPRGGKSRSRGGGGGNIHVDPMHINVNVYDHTGVEQLVQKIELAIQSGLVNGITTGYS